MCPLIKKTKIYLYYQLLLDVDEILKTDINRNDKSVFQFII
jgi:hypothetical protein